MFGKLAVFFAALFLLSGRCTYLPQIDHSLFIIAKFLLKSALLTLTKSSIVATPASRTLPRCKLKLARIVDVSFFFLPTGSAVALEEFLDEEAVPTVDNGIGKKGLETDPEVLQKTAESINSDVYNTDEMQKLLKNADKKQFQTEVNRLMKLIINSLYRNKEIFLRELISNASDALDKIRLLALTEKSVMDSNADTSIKIRADKDNKILSITDSGIGMTKQDLINNLGTIAKSGTAEFLSAMQDSEKAKQMNDMIGQFGVGFYSAFLVADKVVVTTKHNDDKQYIWESDSSSFSIIEDPRGDTLKRGTTISKTVWDWELLNDSKPIWTQKPNEVTEEEYNSFYKSLTKDSQEPLAKVHFIAEGEVTFKSLLFVPKVQPSDSFNRYGTKDDNIKLYVRRVFISDKFNDLMPNYLAFIQGIVDSDDLPLNVSRENLQQHKLIKIIKKKLIRKVLDMMKKIPKEQYQDFWKEYSTNIKLGIIEDAQNRARLAKLLMFRSSENDKYTSLSDYVSRMKPNQQHIFYIAGSSIDEVKKSPFVERLLKKGYEVLYLVEAVDEYALSSVPEYEGKKFQNVAKEGFSLDEGAKSAERKKELEETFEPLIKYLNDKLKDSITKAQLSERLTDSPCALVASMFGWTGNMERLAISNAHQKADDPQKSYYLNQKKTLEINPRHPLIRELLRRVENDPEDETTKSIATMMFQTATLRSGFMLKETASFAENVEHLMRKTLGIPVDEVPEEEDEFRLPKSKLAIIVDL
ncbi:hypothetical protein QAD02_008496 [Eretmocerus hayati]|uniref:Uncharacterized protein n=1 Tax=Eretmocerus hayati TaxID=131215 RepID=A0ACC2N6J3_9HYME|nr:hypothetical protein QAD02_008496 [Eretmocerus hayati]